MALNRVFSIASSAMALLMIAFPASAQVTLAQLLEDIPTGTYNLTFTADADAPDNNPHATGDEIEFILAANGRLCTDDLSLTGASLRTAPDIAVEWRNDLSDSRFYLRATDNNPDPDIADYVFRDIQFLNAGAKLFGVFTLAAPGDYNNSTGSCGASSDPSDAQIDAFFSSAETAFPALFPAGPFTFTQKTGTSAYRFYDSTSITLTISGGQVYARGGSYGGSNVAVGSFQNLNTTINNIIRPASIGNFFVGTYQVEMSDTQPFSTIPDGAEYTYAITASGQLCLSTNTTLTNPVYLNNDTTVAVWRDTAADLSYRLDLSADDDEELTAADGLLQVYSGSGVRFGELAGDRISLTAICETVDPTHPDSLILSEIERLFALAEQLYPEYLAFGPTVSTQRTAEYTFRYYPVSDVFIAVRDGQVYAGDGMPNFSDDALGTLNEVFDMLAESTRDFVPTSSLTGTYDVLVTGANPLFQLPNNSRIRLVIAASGTLCIDNITLTNPTVSRSSANDVSWTNIQAGINAATVLSDETGSVTMSLISTRGENLATLQGNRVNLLATCPQPVMSAVETDTATELFELAERRYPDLFDARNGSTTRSTGGSLSRYYAATDITISISLNEVFVRGGEFGSFDYFVGSVGNLIGELRASPPDQPASVPTLLSGTYSMVVSGANPFAPFANNSEVRMVLSASGELCLENTFSNNPRSSYSAPSVARWTHAAGGFDATLDLLQTSAQLIVNLTSTAGDSLGTLTGSRISNQAFCSGTTLTAAAVQQITDFFGVAELRFPDYFPGNAVNATRQAGGALIRSYPSTAISISVVNGLVYIRGGDFGTSDFYAGTMTDLAVQWRRDTSQAATSTPYAVQVTGISRVTLGGLNYVNKQVNLSTTRTYSATQLTDSALSAIATELLSGEVQSPDSVNISNIIRTGSSLSFTAVLAKTSVLGANASIRNIDVTINLQAQ